MSKVIIQANSGVFVLASTFFPICQAKAFSLPTGGDQIWNFIHHSMSYVSFHFFLDLPLLAGHQRDLQMLLWCVTQSPFICVFERTKNCPGQNDIGFQATRRKDMISKSCCLLVIFKRIFPPIDLCCVKQ